MPVEGDSASPDPRVEGQSGGGSRIPQKGGISAKPPEDGAPGTSPEDGDPGQPPEEGYFKKSPENGDSGKRPESGNDSDRSSEAEETNLDGQLTEIRRWLDGQPHLPHNLSDDLLTSFLVGCKHDMGRVKTRLDNLFLARSTYLELLSNRDPLGASMAAANKLWYMFDVHKCTLEGYTAIFVRFQERAKVAAIEEGFNVVDHFIDFHRKFLMLIEFGLMSTPRDASRYVIADMSDVLLSHLPAISPIKVRRLIKTVLECIPVQLKGVIFFNLPYLLSAGLNGILRVLLKKKIYKRLHFYSSGAECLANHFKVDLLPAEYGGINKTLAELNDDCIQRMVDKRDWFLTEGSYSSDESKRPKDLKKRL